MAGFRRDAHTRPVPPERPRLRRGNGPGDIIDGCVQLHGAVALRRGHLLEHLYRDVRSLRIYEGASEAPRSMIARDLVGRDYTR